MKTRLILEGSVSLVVPEKSFSDPHHCAVFYNPDMAPNRTFSALFLKTCLEFHGFEKAVLFDGFCGTGVRGLRYAKESGAERVFLCDANDDAIAFVEKNIALNKLTRRAKVLHTDVNAGLSVSPRFDVIELDPFGSPLQCIDSAFRRGKDKFILSLTFTDLANLCGGHKAACKRYYQAVSLHCSFSHELALRIILGRVAGMASLHDYAITPLVSWYQGHYVKVFLLCEKSSAKADENFYKIGYAWLCENCSGRGVSKSVLLSCSCSSQPCFAGPLWIAPFSDKHILRKAFAEAPLTAKKFLGLLASEIDAPLFYDLHELCSKLKINVPRIENFVAVLRKKGFDASRTHFSPYGFKTNASLGTFLRLLN